MNRLLTLFLAFSIYSFIGWTCESIACSLEEKRPVNRGFLNGPFCPVYGVGGVLVVSLLSPFRGDLPVLYLAGVLITSTLEYLTGLFLEKLFHTKYWDYSHRRFNLQGRVCLGNSLVFGVMSCAGVLYVHPAVLRVLSAVPAPALAAVSAALLLYFLLDTAVSVRTVLQLNGKLEELQNILDEIRARASAATTETLEAIQLKLGGLLDEDARGYLKALFAKKEAIENGIRLMQRRVIRAFPTMKSTGSNESLQRLRQALAERARRFRGK